MPNPVHHTALDDLESLTWVILWVGLGIPPGSKTEEHQKQLSDDEQSWLSLMTSGNIANIRVVKRSIFSFFAHPTGVEYLRSDCLFALSGLLTQLFKFHEEQQTALSAVLPVGKQEGNAGADSELAAQMNKCFDSYFTLLDEFLQGNLPPISAFQPT